MNTEQLTRYADAYNPGDVDPENYAQCAAYLEGLLDAQANELSEDAQIRLRRCISTLRGGANLILWVRRQS